MKSRVLVPFIALAGLILLVGLACGTSPAATPTQAPPVTQNPPTEPPPVQTEPPTEEPTQHPADEPPAYFTEEFEGDIPDWSYFLMNGDEEKMTLESGDDILLFDLEGENLWVYILYDPYIYENVRIDARVENRGYNNNNVSLVCRYDDQYGWYEFNIANNGLFWIYAYDMLDDSYHELYNGGSTAIRSGKQVNEYTGICYEDKLSLYINGVEAKTITEKRFVFREGQVGIGTSSFDVLPIIVEWDWVTISEP